MPVQTQFPTAVFSSNTIPALIKSNMVSFWKLNEASGNRADSVGSNTLSPINTPGQKPGLRAGMFAASFLTVSSQRLQTAADPTNLVGGDADWTAGIWVNFTSKIANMGIYCKHAGSGTTGDYRLIYTSITDTFDVAIFNGTSLVGSVTSSSSISLNTWYFVTFGFISSSQTVWVSVNNGSRNTAVATSAPAASTRAVYFGADGGEVYFDGYLQNAFFANAALTDSNLAWLYNHGSARFYPATLTGPGIKISTPSKYSIIQDSGGTANIPITGSLGGGSYTVEASFNGGAYADLATNVSGTFSGTLSNQTSGEGLLTVRLKGTSYTDSHYLKLGDNFTRLTEGTLITHSMGDHSWVGRPTMINLGSSVWAICYRAADGHGVSNNSGLHIRFSSDEGVTWSNEDKFTDGNSVTGFPLTPHNASVGIVEGVIHLAPNNDLLIWGYERALSGTNSYVGTYQYRSTNSGASWSDEGRVNGADTTLIASTLTNVGTDIYATFMYDAGGDVVHPFTAQLWKSTDNGTNWSLVSTISGTTDINEPAVFNTSGNNLLSIIRHPYNTGTAFSYTSTDLGANWGSKINIGQNIREFHRPRMRQFGSDIYLFGRDYIGEYTTVWVSSDSGTTWYGGFHPDADSWTDTGYCDILQKADGTFYLVTYGGDTINADLLYYTFQRG